MSNPCAHQWERLIIGGETIDGRYVDVHRCEVCIETRHTAPDGDPWAAPTYLPGHYKCAEHGRYNCAEEHP